MNAEQVPRFIPSWYEHHPGYRALVCLVPGVGGALDALAATMAGNAEERRCRHFRETLHELKAELTPQMLDDDDLLHAAYITGLAVARTRNAEKQRYFAALFAKYLADGGFAEQADVYEEWLGVLDDLRPREMQALVLLQALERDSQYTARIVNDVQLASDVWPEFRRRMAAEVGVSEDEQPGFLARLNRTGLYRTITGSYFNYGGDMGSTTGYFASFCAALGLGADDDA